MGKYINVIPGSCAIYEDKYGDPDGHPIYLESTKVPGDLDFKTGDIPVSHENGGCVTPSPKNYGGEGNTVGVRSSYFHLSKAAEKLLGYNLPGAIRLYNPPLTVYPHVVNPGENFYESEYNAIYLGYHGTNGNVFHGKDSSTSSGIVLHEMGHAFDYFDGSGGMSNPAEAFADISTMFMTKDSCIGRGFLLDCIYDQSGTCLTPLETYRLCYGYGNPCTSCDGGRDIDYAKHSNAVPSTPTNFVDTYCTQDPYGYNGPCGYKQHCEATIATQAMWDLANRDLPSAMDGPTAWQFAERLFFLGAPTIGNFYGNCSYRNVSNTNGCNAGSLYNVLRAIDDDGDGTANGTPHAAEIYAALNRHGIACTTAGSNNNYTTCPTISKPTGLSATYSSNKVILTWNSVQNASKYEILRAELGCNSSFNKIAEVSAPTTTYTDTEVANNFEYYYRVWAVGSNPSCRSLVSDCLSVTPLPCNGDVIVDNRNYSCNDKIEIYLEDSDIKGTGSLNLIAWSPIEPNPETITLTENPTNSGRFYGSIKTSANSTQGDGAVGVTNNSYVTIRYQDSSSCGSGSQNKDITVNIDCSSPLISNLQIIGITDEEATVVFTTSEPANCKIVYDSSTPPVKSFQEIQAQYVTYHLINLKDLSPCTTYYFSLILMDNTGNIFLDNNGGNYYSFKTRSRQYLFQDNMEGGSSNWTVDGDGSVCDMSHPYQWYLLQNCKQHSGSYAWRAGDETCEDSFCYMRCSHWLELTNPLNLGTGGWRLRWKEWYKTFEQLRQQYVFISINGGPWNIIGVNYGGTLPKYTGPESFIHRDEDISSYTGNAKIRFRFEEYDFYSFEGWYVDDVDISKVVPCSNLPELQYQSFTKTETCNGTGSGGGNNYIEPGEDVNLTLTIKNIGNSTATGVYTTISSTDPGVIITDPTASFPNIPAGQTAIAIDTVSFRVNPSISCGTVININLRMGCNQGFWDDSVRIYVGQGSLTTNEYVKSYPSPYLSLSDAGTTTSTIVVSGNSGLVTRVKVYIGFISHFRAEDLDIYLIGPNNVKVELSTDNGGKMNDYLNTYFRDDYLTPIQSGIAPFIGNFKPEGSLSSFIGIPANGSWRLEIVDDSYGYSGKLYEWGISLETSPNPPVCASCTPTVSGVPNIVYMSRGSFTQITGNGDAYFDRGEKWSVPVSLRNNGSATATNVTAKLSGNDIIVCSPGYFGTIAPGGNASFNYEFVISSDFPQCGGEIRFDIIDKASNELTPAGWNEYSVFKIQNVGKLVQAPLTNEELGRTGTIPGKTTTYFYTVDDPVTSTPGTLTGCKVDISLTPPCPSKSGTITVVVEHGPGNDGTYEYTQQIIQGVLKAGQML